MRAHELLPRLIQAAAKGPDAVLKALEEPLRSLGFSATATTAQPRALMWRRGRPRLAFSGHVDVVPAGEGWTRDPFGGEVADGRIWGRGACDMLGAIAAYVGAAARAPDAPCAILLTTDEETGMKAAGLALREGLLQGIESVVVGEPTDMELGVAEKGVLWLRVVTEGRNAHGSMPHLGDNAAERLVRALHGIEGLRLEGDHALLGAATRNLGRLGGGEAVNQVPASAWAELDIRYLPGMTSEAIQARVLAHAAPERPRLEVVSDHAPFETSPDTPLARASLLAFGRALGKPPAVVGLPYGTEASKFAPAGLACVIAGPGERGLAHTSRESVRLDWLDAAERAYADLMRGYDAERGA